MTTSPHSHDWRGIDTGRMCKVCGEIDTMTARETARDYYLASGQANSAPTQATLDRIDTTEHHKVLAELDPWLRLRGAAPQLLEALLVSLPTLESWANGLTGVDSRIDEVIVQVRAAIKAAKGEL